ncbi:MAG: GTP-binding protein [Prochlorotrichaceae cyanobacterium]
MSLFKDTLLQSWIQSSIQDYQNRPAVLQAVLHSELASLKAIVQRLEHPIVTIASFGLVSRGKSAVCNALLGEKRLATGALHGVTRWPRSLRWRDTKQFAVDLVDTPGLDEVAGASRTEMTEAIVKEADLLLFVVNSPLNSQEVAAIETIAGKKPLFLVLNKMDLYSETELKTIVDQLKIQVTEVFANLGADSDIPVIPVAAEPLPRRVQVESPEGQVTEQWETPPPQVEVLEQALHHFLQTRAIVQFRQQQQQQAERILQTLAEKTQTFYQADSDRLQQRFLQARMLWVAISPWAVLDVMGALILDLLFIRSLGKLYQLPITSPGANRERLNLLWQTIVHNLSLLAVGEWASHWFGLGDLSVLNLSESWGLLGAILIQSLWAGYGSDRIGRAARHYFTQPYFTQPYFSQSDREPNRRLGD